MLNQVMKDARFLEVPCDHPAAPVAGEAVRFGAATGVAVQAEGAGGVLVAANTVVDFGQGVYRLPVRAINDGGNSAIVVGDTIFRVDADTPYLSKKSSGFFFGFALQANPGVAGEITTIEVLHVQSPGSGALGAGTVGTANLANGAVTTAKIGALQVTAAELAADAVITAKILNANVTTAKIADANVTEAKLVAPAATSGLGVVRTARAKYVFATDGGAISTITPAANSTIPDNAIIVGGIINAVTAPTSAGAATLSFGTSAGSGAASLKGVTAIATFTIDSLVATVPVWTAASAVKLTAAGSITMTIADFVLTAGVIEVTVFYIVASA